ncbi:MAG: hypothetical protein HC908_07030 [Calothrix sp. SM1_7_51]|nr:hypothetical protein [Calothrix sp. SM1_7_51]
MKNSSQVSIFQDTVHEPPLPEDCHSLQHFEQSCVEWHKQQPELPPEIPFVMPDEVPISKRFSGCRFEVRIFASSRFHGKSQAWIVDTQTQQAVEGYDNLGNFQDFAECYEKCQHLTAINDRLASEASALESSYQEWKLITVANKPISVPYG